MSLSDQNEGDSQAASEGGAWGTVFSRGAEHSLGSLETSQAKVWTPDDEAAYLRRVREKAEQLAASLLADARTQAEQLREKARKEGYAAGMADAEAELEHFRGGMSESVSAMLGSIEGQCSHLFDQWRGELVGVSKLAVEKITGLVLSEERAAMLEALLVEAVGVLEKRREVVIRVNPEDEQPLADMLEMTQARFPDVKSWRVRADAGITSGGMVVESESSLAEGRLESRRAAVDEVLEKLVLADFAAPPQEEDAAPGSSHA